MALYLILYGLFILVGVVAFGPALVVAAVILAKVARRKTRPDGVDLLRRAAKGALVVGLVGGSVVTAACALMDGNAIEQVVVIFLGAAVCGFGWAGAWDLYIPG